MTKRFRAGPGRATAGLIALGLVAGACGANAPGPASAPGASQAVQRIQGLVDPDRGFVVVRLGSLPVRGRPTLQSAGSAFGRPDACRNERVNAATAVWRRLGLRIHFVTYGAVPGRNRPCAAPGAMPVDQATLADRAWMTPRGLRVGDTIGRLQTLYPRAAAHGAVWWLHIGRGYTGVNVPHLFPAIGAVVRKGRVATLVVRIGAQGE
jgi:hypothetical protein